MKKSKKSVTKAASANKRKRVTLTVDTARGAEIFVAGSFNDWKLDHKQLIDENDNGFYSCSLLLDPGTYEYKFKVNGDWMIDVNNPNFVPNQFGSLNSLLDVQ